VKIQTCAIAAAMIGQSIGFAQDAVLVDNPAHPDELIADQRTLIPCRMPVEFTSFRYPHVDAEANVTFIGDDPYYRGGTRFGVYRSDGKSGEVVKLLNNEDLPGSSAVMFSDFLGLQMDGTHFVFRGRRADGGGGIYGDFGDGLRVIADTSTQAVPVFGSFRSFGYADVSGDLVVFTATDGAGTRGVFSYRVGTRILRRLVDSRTVLSDGSSIAYFNGQPWVDEGAIVFRGLNDAGKPAIYKISRTARDGAGSESVEILFDDQTPMPSPLLIDDITSAPVEGGLVAFQASGVDAKGARYSGIFLIRDGKVSVVADSRTLIPEENVAFHSFNKWIALQNGMVIFCGQAAEGFEGIFAFDSSNSELHQLINNRASIGGRRIKSFEIAANPLVGSRIAFLAVFKDGRDSLYLASLEKGALKSAQPIATPSLAEALKK